MWVWKAVEAARLIGRSLGRQVLAATLAGAYRRLEDCASLGGFGAACLLEATRHQLRSFVLKAIRRRDLDRAGKGKEQQGLQQGADVEECRRILKRFPTQGLQEAARAVATGDVVTRSQSRFWQGHDGTCHWGGEGDS